MQREWEGEVSEKRKAEKSYELWVMSWVNDDDSRDSQWGIERKMYWI